MRIVTEICYGYRLTDVEEKDEVYKVIMGGQVLEYEAKAILNKGKTEARNEDIKILAEYFVKETPRLSYDDAVKMVESILKKEK